MGFLDALFGRRRPVESPEELLRLLTEAAAAGDDRGLARLCSGNADAIFAHFPTWQKVPDSIRRDRVALDRHARMLISAARQFAASGRPELMQRLMGPPEANPIRQWDEKLGRALDHMKRLEYEQAEQILQDCLIDHRGIEGPGYDRYAGLTYGKLGECAFHSGRTDRALDHFRRALETCQRAGDTEGIFAYVNALYETSRYRGDAGAAADNAEQFSRLLREAGRTREAMRWATQAAIVRAGEPLLRTLVAVGDETYEVDDAPPVRDGSVQIVFQRNRPTLEPARVLVERGGQLGGASRYVEALAAFRDAAKRDPFDPHPHYESGVTLLHLGRAAEAVEEYEKTEELAPGWFHCRSQLWLARQLVLGRLPDAAFAAMRLLEDAPPPPPKALEAAEAALKSVGNEAFLHAARGQALRRLGRNPEAIAAFRAGLAVVPEPDIRTRLLVDLAIALPSGPERTSLLREAAELGGNLTSAAMARYVLRGGG